VTVDGVTHSLGRPFMVLATQNPIDYEGTFSLPEAQLDRFLLRVRLGYPAYTDEIRVLEEQQIRHPLETLKPVVRTKEILAAADAIRRIFVSPAVKKYIVDLVRRTRESDDVYLGASPRGSLGIFRAAQARAGLLGRDHVLPDDVKAMAVAVLGHRIIVSPAARLRDLSADRLVEEIVRATSAPGGDFASVARAAKGSGKGAP